MFASNIHLYFHRGGKNIEKIFTRNNNENIHRFALRGELFEREKETNSVTGKKCNKKKKCDLR